jgi:hypothetical protein
MRAAVLVLGLLVAGCGQPVGTMTEQQAAAITRATMAQYGVPPPGTPQTEAERDAVQARLNAENEARLRLALARERREETQAQLFGMEWRMTRVAMQCDDPAIRRVAYATADLQDRHLLALNRRSPRLANISAAEDRRLEARTFAARPNQAECRRLLTIMGESAKAIRDGER